MANSRGYSGQMDFDYDNKIGPVSANSPFMQGIRAQQSQAGTAVTDSMPKKRPYSAYESPHKSSSGFADLRNPSNRPLFSQSNHPGMPNPFATPRVSHESDIPSSGPETSPENVDSDATPDTSRALIKANSMKIFTGLRSGTDGQHSPLAKHASGRGEIRPRGNGAITKRRRKDNLLHHKHSLTFDDDTDDEPPRSKRPRTPKSPDRPPKHGFVGAFFDFLDARPGLPATLSRYAQLVMNITLIGIFLSLLLSFIATIRSDVNKKAAEVRAGVLAEIAQCAKQFTDNKCHVADTLAPALHAPCAEWKQCMDKDANQVQRALVSAHTFAEIFNEFVEPISWKAFLFCIVIAFVCFAGGNMAFMLFRNRLGGQQQPAYYHVAPTPQHQGQWVPPTPGHALGYDGMGYGQPPPHLSYYGTPAQQRQQSPVRPGLEPAPSWSLESRTPSR